MFTSVVEPFGGIVSDQFRLGARAGAKGRPPDGLPLSESFLALPSHFVGEVRDLNEPLPPGVERTARGGYRWTGDALPSDYADVRAQLQHLQDLAADDDVDDADDDARNDEEPVGARAERARRALDRRTNAQGDRFVAGLARDGLAHAHATDERAACVACGVSILSSCGGVSVACSSCDPLGPVGSAAVYCTGCDASRHLVQWWHHREVHIAGAASQGPVDSLDLSGASLPPGHFIRRVDLGAGGSRVDRLPPLPSVLPISPLDTCLTCSTAGQWRVDGAKVLGHWEQAGDAVQANKQRTVVLMGDCVAQVAVPPTSAITCGARHACADASCSFVGSFQCPRHSICGAAFPRQLLSTTSDIDVRHFVPNTAVEPRLFVHVGVLHSWRALIEASPGTSTQGFSRFLSLLHRSYDDVTALLPSLPRDASLASLFFGWCRVQDLNDLLRGIESQVCPSCGVHDASVDAYSVAHIDGNAKLYSYKRSGGSTSSMLDYTSTLHLADDEVSRHWDSLRAHVAARANEKSDEMPDDSACGSAFAATKVSKFATLRESGALLATCAHCHIIRWANLHGGEKYMYAEALAHHGLEMRGKTPKFLSYDIACRWWPSVSKLHAAACARGPLSGDDAGSPPAPGDAAAFPPASDDAADFCDCFDAHGVAQEAFRQRCNTYNVMLGMLHNKAHGLSCQLRYDPTFFRGAGWLTCETTEQVNSYLSRLGNAVKHLGPETRVAYLDRVMALFNVSKQENAPATLYGQLVQAVDRVFTRQKEFDGLLARLNAVSQEAVPAAVAPPTVAAPTTLDAAAPEPAPAAAASPAPYSAARVDGLLASQRAMRGLGRDAPTAPGAVDPLVTGGRNSRSSLLAELLEIETKLRLASSLRSVLDSLVGVFYAGQASINARGSATGADVLVLRSVLANHSATVARLAALSPEIPALQLRQARIRGTLQREPYRMSSDELNRLAGAAGADSQICELVADISRYVQRQGGLMALRDDTRGAGSRVYSATEQLKAVAKRLTSLRGMWATFIRFASPGVQQLQPPPTDHLLKMRNVEEFASALRATLSAAASPGAGAAAAGAVSQMLAQVTEGLVMELVRSRAAVLSAREELGNIVRALEHNISYYKSDRATACTAALSALDVPPAEAASPPLPTGDVAGAYARELNPSRLVTATIATAALRPPCGLASSESVRYVREGLRMRLLGGRRRAACLQAVAERYHGHGHNYLMQRVGVGADASALDALVNRHEPLPIAPESDELKKQARDPYARANAQAMLEIALKHGAIPAALSSGGNDGHTLDDLCEHALQLDGP